MDREQEFMAVVERYKRVAYKVCSIYAPDAGQVEGLLHGGRAASGTKYAEQAGECAFEHHTCVSE